MPQVHTQSLCTAHTEQWESDRECDHRLKLKADNSIVSSRSADSEALLPQEEDGR